MKPALRPPVQRLVRPASTSPTYFKPTPSPAPAAWYYFNAPALRLSAHSPESQCCGPCAIRRRIRRRPAGNPKHSFSLSLAQASRLADAKQQQEGGLASQGRHRDQESRRHRQRLEQAAARGECRNSEGEVGTKGCLEARTLNLPGDRARV